MPQQLNVILAREGFKSWTGLKLGRDLCEAIDEGVDLQKNTWTRADSVLRNANVAIASDHSHIGAE